MEDEKESKTARISISHRIKLNEKK